MFSSRIVRTLLLASGLAILALLLIAFAAQFQTWRKQSAAQRGNVQTLELSSQVTTGPIPEVTPTESSLKTAMEGRATHTPFPVPWPVNEQGTPFNPNELTPILTIPVVNPQGTPLTPTPSEEDMLNVTPADIPTSTPGGPPTPTPRTYVTRVNLAEGLPDSEVWLIIVLRADGNLDEYRIPVAQVRPLLGGEQPDREGYLALRDTLFQLKPGEAVVSESIASSGGRGLPPPALPEELTAQAETPSPLTTDVIDSSSQDAEPVQLHLPQVGN